MPARTPPIHTIPVDGGWANKPEGATRAGPTYPTRANAEAAGRVRARRDTAEHVSHRRDGTIGDRRAYGSDPNPPPG